LDVQVWNTSSIASATHPPVIGYTVWWNNLANLQSRGLRTDRSLLVILDGSKALRKAVRATFGEAALVQRCQVHKTSNILEYPHFLSSGPMSATTQTFDFHENLAGRGCGCKH
jgi:hypothetical protein